MHMAPGWRIAVWLVLLAGSWFATQAVHECGHVLGAWLTGGTVQRVLLHPLELSRTDVSPKPRPLVVAWSGPLIGVALPLLAVALFRVAKWPGRRVVEFFAGFCLIANGAYIGAGSFAGIGDAGDMLRHGSPQWLLIVFGLVASVAGLWIWHKLTARPIAKSAI
jgi:hypothetical protein